MGYGRSDIYINGVYRCWPIHLWTTWTYSNDQIVNIAGHWQILLDIYVGKCVVWVIYDRVVMNGRLDNHLDQFAWGNSCRVFIRKNLNLIPFLCLHLITESQVIIRIDCSSIWWNIRLRNDQVVRKGDESCLYFCFITGKRRRRAWNMNCLGPNQM